MDRLIIFRGAEALHNNDLITRRTCGGKDELRPGTKIRMVDIFLERALTPSEARNGIRVSRNFGASHLDTLGIRSYVW